MSDFTDDGGARRRALTDLSSTLMVEAAAGTGKTSLLAGRLTLMLAHGIDPASIAAITFTEFAAAELAARVRHYTIELLAGRVPPALASALPDGLSGTQREALRRGTDRLEELTATTIHSFCMMMIRDHALEAGVDPGARIMDDAARDAVFASVFDEWFGDRMAASADPESPSAVLARDDPAHVVGMLRKLAEFRLAHRSARPCPAGPIGRPDLDLVSAIDDFTCRAAACGPEKHTDALVVQLARLATFYSGTFGREQGFAGLWSLAHPPRLPCMRKGSVELFATDARRVWRRAVSGSGGAGIATAGLEPLFDIVDVTFRRLLGTVAASLVGSLSGDIDGLLAAYDERKRSAASLDFDDILERARSLLRDIEPVRAALARRFRHVLIDEFQDTDPVQCEILLRLTAVTPSDDWRACTPAPGALFIVGDPKQAIYRFRGAALETYAIAKAAVLRSQPDGVLRVTANFRSRPGILRHVNACFRGPLGKDVQPGYVDLSPTLTEPGHGLPCAARLSIGPLPHDASARDIRTAEAEAVARLCASLLEPSAAAGRGGSGRRLMPGDIALLTPTGSELWIYEKALEDLGLPVASYAGKGLFRRQEVQDLVALVRVLADPGDTMAFGALMRGPQVGLTDGDLLDITAGLPPGHGPIPRFDVRTGAELVTNTIARDVLSKLQGLRARARSTAPARLLSEAVELLDVRSKLRVREPFRAAAASANVDAVIERASAYGVRGLGRLARDLDAAWRGGAQVKEGVVDAGRDAISIVTVHGSKGLEWPVVIPINTATRFRPRPPFVHRPSDDTLHWLAGDVVPPGLAEAMEADAVGETLERERRWYVACTRARDLLVLPSLPSADRLSWARVIDLAQADLPDMNLGSGARSATPPAPEQMNMQTAAVFAAEAAAIAASSAPVDWLRPSDEDADRLPMFETSADESDTAMPDREQITGGGRVRGLVIHKLLEELLTAALDPTLGAMTARARMLLDQLAPFASGDDGGPSPAEMAGTVSKAIALPEVARLWPLLVPEVSVYGMAGAPGRERPLAGRADALAVEDGRVSAAIDWKTDVDPTASDRRDHAEQLRLYMAATGATEGIIVYVSSGTTTRVQPV